MQNADEKLEQWTQFYRRAQRILQAGPRGLRKLTGAELTRTTVTQLAEPEVVSELVRMLGADADDTTALRHARGLRRAA